MTPSKAVGVVQEMLMQNCDVCDTRFGTFSDTEASALVQVLFCASAWVQHTTQGEVAK